MTKLKKALAMILSLVLLVTVLPATSKKVETRAAEAFAITSPTANQLKAAGYIDITWSAATAGEVKDYQLYIDNQLITTTTGTTYEYYTTKVKSFDTYVKANYINGTSENTATITFGVTKKGLGLAADMGANLDLADMGIGWYYNWGTGPSSGQQYRGIEFVPMQWGNDSYNNINNRMNGWANQGYKYALAFNEPDLAGQGVTSVDDAVNRWPAYLNHGIRVGSPASFLWPSISTWLKDFMVRIDNNVDFVTIHCYPENNPGGKAMADWFLKDVVDSAWELYHKPIWITEFSTADTSADNHNVTAEGTAEFWDNVMAGLDEREYVERYAAFGFKSENKPGVGLWYYDTGELTLGGEAYKNNGNPANFTPAGQEDQGYKITESVRTTLLPKSLTINSVSCEDYVSAAGVTASATSEINGDSSADKAIDDDIKSRWESVQGIDPQALTIDLGTVRSIKQVSIVWENASASNYTVEVSTDGQNFTPVATAENMGAKQNRSDTILLSQMTSARYVRINGTARATAYGYSIYDVAIYGTDNTKVDETTTKAPATTREQSTASQQGSSNLNLSVLNGAQFVGYVGADWAFCDATVTAVANGDATIHITNSGGGWNDAIWGIQAQYQRMSVLVGKEYTYTATLTSTKDKQVTVKVSPNGEKTAYTQEIITLKAGQPYQYKATFTATSTMADVAYAFCSPEGESVQNADITIQGNKLTVTPDPTTAVSGTEQEATAAVSGSKLAKAKVTKATKKKGSAKAKITLKKVTGATKYQVQIAATKKFQSVLVKKTVKKVSFTIKGKKIKNKTKLFVRARAVAGAGGKTQTGAWSKAKKVKIKK